MDSSLRKQLAEKAVSTKKEEKSPATRKDVAYFFIAGIVWSIVYLLIPLIVWLVTRDWTGTLSLCGKIGIGMIALSLLLLAGRDKLGAATASRYVPTGKSSADSRVAETEREAARESLVLQIIAPIGVWLLFWGIIFVVPFAFGVPFLMN
ncbi:MAG: hypothetical protein KAU62_05635 [Candidatus Heimdallarchaeota archaeon]|nr:hypothetical protein [Candidatus Heimdallarchaeota archaeon]MCG3255547.1 hypothetical protein [Candidatus Heimdallarchaeota archaeon]MCK4610622.1 hypothetical protein [Candidatus Heimdallarchaeota archaeon]